MFQDKDWIFKGFSGKEYPFKIMRKNSDFEPVKAIYVFAYKHPRGHLAGFLVHPLFIGQTDNLKQALINHPEYECVNNECYNCVYIMLSNDNEAARQAIVDDLLQESQVPCGTSQKNLVR